MKGLFITSIDFIARHEGCLRAATETQWDLIAVDEAHKLSAFEYGAKVERSDRYEAVEALASRTDHLLVSDRDTTPGPQGYLPAAADAAGRRPVPEGRARYPARPRGGCMAATGEAFDGEAAISNARNRFFLRRLKEEMVGWDGHHSSRHGTPKRQDTN